MLRALKYMKPYLLWVIIIFILIGTRSWLNLYLPNYMRNILNDLNDNSLVHDQKIASIWINGAWMLANTFAGIILILLSGFLESRVSSSYANRLRRALYEKIETFSMYEMDELTTSSLITRTTNDIAQLQQTVNMLLRMAVLLPFMAIGAIVMAFSLQPSVSVIIVFAVIAVLTIVGTIIFIALPKFKLIQLLIDKLNLVTRENLSGLKVVRAYNTYEYQSNKTKKVADEMMKRNIFVNRLFTLMWPAMGLVQSMLSVGMALIIKEYNLIYLDSSFTHGDLSAMIQYGMQTIMSFMMITFVLMMIPRAAISAKRVMEVIDKDITVKDPTNPLLVPSDIKGEITFNNVTFSYPNSKEPVLKDISFTAKAGKTTAFIGSTGSGKSTLINLIPRFYDPSEGTITIDGYDIKAFNQNDLLKLIGYVPQKGNLFKGTIESNIGFGQDNIDKDIIESSAKIAQASDFINEFDDNYQHQISQGGTNVSGGQRQRLSIARALAKQPKIYIFDDSFSALDYKTDAKLRKELEKNINATLLIVAQRVNTIRNADLIVVLDQGQIVGMGKHQQLLKDCQVYQEIASLQLPKEELANE